MRVILQRSIKGSVEINNEIYSEINKGLIIFIGFANGDNEQIIDKMINKIINLRVFKDSNNLTNLSLLDVKGSILSVSQFTLYADTNNGRRPSFVNSLNPTEALKLYNLFNSKIKKMNIDIKTGIFGDYMKINIINDGPFTIFLDSNELK